MTRRTGVGTKALTSPCSDAPQKRLNHSLHGLGGEWGDRSPIGMRQQNDSSKQLSGCVSVLHTLLIILPRITFQCGRTKAQGKRIHTQYLKHTSPSLYIPARGNMMLGLNYSLILSGPVACHGVMSLSLHESVHLKGLAGKDTTLRWWWPLTLRVSSQK